MSLQEKIKNDLVAAMKAKDEDKKDALRVIMGEFGRLPKKEITDTDVIHIIKKLVKSEKEVMKQKGDTTPSPFLLVAQSYLPRMATEQEIRTWIDANIDFDSFNNKMQAMKPIMQHFGGNADGKLVQKILSEF